jgi:type IV secretory pathway VirD2 relaxase
LSYVAVQSNIKKHLHIADIHIHPNIEHQRAVLIQVEIVHQENHQAQQVLLRIQEPNRLLQVANQQVHHQRNQIIQAHQRAVRKRRIIIIHMMMAMIQFMMMAIMMITDMTGIQTMLMV